MGVLGPCAVKTTVLLPHKVPRRTTSALTAQFKATWTHDTQYIQRIGVYDAQTGIPTRRPSGCQVRSKTR